MDKRFTGRYTLVAATSNALDSLKHAKMELGIVCGELALFVGNNLMGKTSKVSEVVPIRNFAVNGEQYESGYSFCTKSGSLYVFAYAGI